MRTLSAVRPSAALEIRYRRKLAALIRRMNEDVLKEVKAQYEETPPLAMDASPSKELSSVMEKLVKKWQKQFDKMSGELAKYFSDAAYKQTSSRMRSILKRGGITVEFKMNAECRDIVNASIAENVQLIKSIPQQYLTDVQGAVMRSVATGRDVGSLTKEIRKKYGVTQRRAANIALDQNNKATSALNKARSVEVGLLKGIWKHSHGGRKPRPTHVKMDGKQFVIAEGMYDSDPRVKRYIQPGELIHCGCFFRPVIA